MKTVSLIILLMFNNVYADQVSYSEGSGLHDTSFYSVSQDRKLQYNYGDEVYGFLRYQDLTVRPYYGGIDYTIIGLGIGKNHPIGKITLFTQAGFCLVKNSVGKVKFHEPTYYDFNYRFNNGNERIRFTSYEVSNDNTLSATVGFDTPLTESIGVKVSYQYLIVRENRTATINSTAHWEDIADRNLSTINIGIFGRF